MQPGEDDDVARPNIDADILLPQVAVDQRRVMRRPSDCNAPGYNYIDELASCVVLGLRAVGLVVVLDDWVKDAAQLFPK